MKRGSIYPSWRYHKTDPPVLCADAAHDAELGDEWSDEDIREVAPETPAAAAAEPSAAPAESAAPVAKKAKKAKKR